MHCIDGLVLQQNFIFYSPNELEIKLSSVGISCECLALEKGFFKAFLSIKSNGFVSQVRLRFNKKVIITGDRPPNRIWFSYCHSTGFSENDYPLVISQILQPHSVAGFGSLAETSCILPAGMTSIHFTFDAKNYRYLLREMVLILSLSFAKKQIKCIQVKQNVT